jgi:hypothetical protein
VMYTTTLDVVCSTWCTTALFPGKPHEACVIGSAMKLFWKKIGK